MSLAQAQVHRVALLSDFLEHPALSTAATSASPVTMPPTLGSMGFDVPLWLGFGVVGLWAALDSYLERTLRSSSKCSKCHRPGCLVGRLLGTGKLAVPSKPLEELEDLRHLYAHNFAGTTDPQYFTRPRHVLATPTPATLSCGAQYNGSQVALAPSHLRFYADRARETLQCLQ